MSKPYLTDRATTKIWADDGDARAARLLAENPEAIAFGVDDGAVQVAFRSVSGAGLWLEDMLADHWHVESDVRTA